MLRLRFVIVFFFLFLFVSLATPDYVGATCWKPGGRTDCGVVGGPPSYQCTGDGSYVSCDESCTYPKCEISSTCQLCDPGETAGPTPTPGGPGTYVPVNCYNLRINGNVVNSGVAQTLTLGQTYTLDASYSGGLDQNAFYIKVTNETFGCNVASESFWGYDEPNRTNIDKFTQTWTPTVPGTYTISCGIHSYGDNYGQCWWNGCSANTPVQWGGNYYCSGPNNSVTVNVPGVTSNCLISSISPASATCGGSTNVTYSGKVGVGAPAQKINLWLERTNGQPISGLAVSPWYDTVYNRYFYKIDTCPAAASGGTCEKTVSVTIPPSGDYYFHCDVQTDPGKCSGSPFCDYYGGNKPCSTTGWVPCSGVDHVNFSQVWPAYVIQGLKKDYLTGSKIDPRYSGQTVSIPSLSWSSTANPYGVSVSNGEQDYAVNVSVPAGGTTVGYTLCYNDTSCHYNAPTWASSVTVDYIKACKENFDPSVYPLHYADLHWHFVAPSPSPQIPACGPSHYECTIGVVGSQNDGDPLNWTWTCSGSYGGGTISCSESKACQVTTVPAALAVPVGTTDYVTASVTSGLKTATVESMKFGSYAPTIASVTPDGSENPDTIGSTYSTVVTGKAGGFTAVWATATLSD